MKDHSRMFSKSLSLVVALDVSENNLSGDLPEELTKLLGLVSLNLSRNHISGHVPESISKLKVLESLDLSNNRFSGAIPESLKSLSFLGYLNLSNNDLSGRIPYKDHMITFEASCYGGNQGLCGAPLAVKCPDDEDDGSYCHENGLNDPDNRLSSWKGSNCCQWHGISCENSTGAVITVDLHNPYPEGFHSSGRYVFYNLSGEITPSLPKLKSLRHLDLSLVSLKMNENDLPMVGLCAKWRKKGTKFDAKPHNLFNGSFNGGDKTEQTGLAIGGWPKGDDEEELKGSKWLGFIMNRLRLLERRRIERT
ncbi:hypothetical protein FEM48_Zijuj05G0022200 [Ziziphus jujuba var. spinosa]|uniref:Leucine-rich repeat-containing N-terminal plant-type domain-containing protein n=1 Tax=Ziziphus jujuba var. spinosa TaxID=714518 RepID=A0A978VC79_ZIZJJ|nr:hypothetical protein FEM48_Zijuj05G0022200 [Ziziphus jujuba var. spinosa]